MKRRFLKAQQRWLQYILIKILLKLIALPPRKIALKIAAVFGSFAFLILKKDRNRSIDNLTRIFGKEKSQTEIQKIARDCFVHLAKNVVDAVHIPDMTSADFDRLVTSDDLIDFDAAVKRGKGLVALTGHIGNWELMAAWFASKGYPVSVVGRRLYDERLNKMLIELRQRSGVKNIDRDDSARVLLRALRKGGVLGILIDQDTKVGNVNVDFFGIPARTPVGIARLVIKIGVAVIPLGIHRQADESYHITIRPHIPAVIEESEDESEQDALVRLTQRFNEELEELIRQDIAQWVWMHRRWRFDNTRQNSSE
ncbi:MAG: hypothetical protein B6244_03405 [Candidatus Cloacimonetes bacterium 4572_55]|nr:MAG: hypothetical protein B6244_03405 [Candidatus Cloacimonetes bacterium 4572_55]